MAWAAPSSRTTGTLITAAIWNSDVVDNPIALRAGGIAVASQAAQDFLYASSASQLARLAAVDGKVPKYTTAGGWAMAAAGYMELLKENSGTDTSVGATNVDTHAMASGLTVKDTLYIVSELESLTVATVTPRLYNSTDSLALTYLKGNNAGAPANMAIGEKYIGHSIIGNAQDAVTAVYGLTIGKILDTNAGHEGTGTSASFATNWTGAWTLALRHGGVSGGTFKWRWAVYAVRGQ